LSLICILHNCFSSVEFTRH